MSAELETSKEGDDVKEQKMKKTPREYVKQYWHVAIKVLELFVCAICLGFMYEPMTTQSLGQTHRTHIGLIYTAYTGYMVINGVLLISKAIGDQIPYRTVSLFAVIGSCLFLVTGILLIVDITYLAQHYNPTAYTNELTMITIADAFTFLNVIVFAADAILTFINHHDF